MKNYSGLCAFAATLLLGVSTTSATLHQVLVYLDGLQETPPNASPGSGSADVSFDDITGQMIVSNGTFSGMVGTVSNAHVHGYAGPGTPAGVVFGLTFAGGTSGTFSGSGFPNIANTMAGLTYINVHSSVFPGGELRGQIIIPEPASLALVAPALLLLGRHRRRA